MSVSPSSPGRISTPGPHKCGRAGFPHPVLRAMGSLQIWDHAPRIRTHLSSLSSHSGKELVSSWSLLPLSRLSPWPGSPLSSAGSLGRFPHFVGHIEELRLPTPVPGHFGRPSCARYHPCARCSLLPSASAPLEAEGCVRIPSPGCFYEWRRGASQVPGEPLHPAPCSRTTVGPSHLAQAMRRCCRRTARGRRPPTTSTFSRLNRTALMLAVYASRPHSSSDTRKTRFRLLARLCRAGFFRLPGSIERFPHSLPPFPGFAWRDVLVSCPCATSVVRVSWSGRRFALAAPRWPLPRHAGSGQQTARRETPGSSTRRAPR